MLLEYKNLRIRNATPADAEILANWWNDGKIMAHAGFPKGLGETAESIARKIETDDDNKNRRLILEQDDLPIGEMAYYNLGDKVAEIGIKICDFSKQEKGMGRIYLSMLIQSLFEDFGFEKIVLDTNLKNERAQHVYEKLGFKKVRINYDSWKNQLGELESSVDYELYQENFVNFAKE
ncbi:MAG: GNAT family N-acetyltransferase [Roseburia sp.]|nr:GNAT family N-acetyltransferase [Roseburia sp.]